MPGIATSDLIFSEQANHNFSKTLGAIKRSTLSIHNRLRSIQEDAAFAARVAEAYNRPLIANERCGSWYIDPAEKAGSAYFKSTDGHTGVWKFSLRRLNFHLLELVGRHDGCIIVDSTRRGKRMSDALSKTIPIWCSVVNRLLFPSDPQFHDLYTPPLVVSKSEHAQISSILPNFVEAIKALQLPLDPLRAKISKPLRPFWITPDSNTASVEEIYSNCLDALKSLQLPQDAPRAPISKHLDFKLTDKIYSDFHPIICCTVSRRVVGGEVSEGGYIQGAGDDTENWACGLTPSLFWANRDLLLSTPEYDLPGLIQLFVGRAVNASSGDVARLVKPTVCLFVAALPNSSMEDSGRNSCTIALMSKITKEAEWLISSARLEVGLGPHKLGSRNLRAALAAIAGFVNAFILRESSVRPVDVKRIIVACESGKDFSIGVALALLCLIFDDEGNLLKSGTAPPTINKTFIKCRLGWISTSIPDANPSRATLQSVNSFLIERP